MNSTAEQISTVNLCRTCKNEFAECKANPKFGTGEGNDNVYECDEYIKLDGKPRW